MGTKPAHGKQHILDAAYRIASEKGLSGLSIREVARACDVAVGTVYNSYPTKSDLVNDVVGRFWKEALADRMPQASAGGDFVDFCHNLATELTQALARFHHDWLAEVSALDAHDLAAARCREEIIFAHIRKGLELALDHDPHVNRARLEGPLAPEELSMFVWLSMLASIKLGDPSCKTLLALLRATLY